MTHPLVEVRGNLFKYVSECVKKNELSEFA